ncbi:dolichol-phosphate mannosyltransferase subunit 3-like isoform X1 [Corticium candelabrum]|uniref:dolichol-phosphate mannosyltransferase subunit 3-like isoform X1 n=1 Tax=Corticium candelabrum TaxID=121492 RepID=UPI002E26CB61|nr:dolichol-phosphate mannosyltransferase subunit 3-like isoform X1 [Corticium candelabrum]
MAVTKLVQWVVVLGLFLGLWCGAVTETFPVALSSQIRDVLVALPVYLLVAFGCFSLAYIGHKLIVFNDCVEASESLAKEVQEAREDLAAKGFKFS